MNVDKLRQDGQKYMAEHEAPDFEKMLGNPTLKQYFAYYRKGVINGVGFLGSTNLLVFVPNPANIWVGAVVAALAWVAGVKYGNGPQPPVKDKTAWVDASTPPASMALPPEKDVITEAPVNSEPVMSYLDADAEITREDNTRATDS